MTLLETIAELLELKGEQSFKVRAYREAAHQIEGLGKDIEGVHRASELQTIRGVGPSIAAKISEFLEKGRSSYLEELTASLTSGMFELLQAPGLTMERARAIHDQLGVSSLAELAEAGQQGRLRTVPGIGPKTEARLVRDLERFLTEPKRSLLSEALPAADEAMAALRDNAAIRYLAVVGSLRRMVETVGNIDLLAASDKPEQALDAFAGLPIAREVVTREPSVCTIVSRDRLRLTLRVSTVEDFGAAKIIFTGSQAHIRALQVLAKEKGYGLTERGLIRMRDDKRLAGLSEEEIYATLGLQTPPPELRENRGEIEAAGRFELPTLIAEHDIRGDLHVHTTYSDGSATLEAMVQGAIARGYEYIAITDHSVSLRVAGGLSLEKLREQQRAIAAVNQKYAPFRVLSSTEVEIRGDGSLDYPDEALRELDLVTVSLHSARGQNGERATQRVVQAISNPIVAILNHPSGRIIGRRDPYAVDLEALINRAAASGVALELNASPDRLDLSDVWARRARDAGVALAVNTDAHSVGQLSFMRYGISQTRRAWLGREHVLNALSLEELLTWLGRSRGGLSPLKLSG